MSAADRDARQRALAAALGLLALSVFVSLAWLRGSLERISGDEGTYLAMAESLAEDFDLLFTDDDEGRILAAAKPGRKALILQRTGAGISYSKPFLPAIVAAPFFAVLGGNGLIVANLVLLAGALYLLWLYLQRLGSSGPAVLTLVTFASTGALLPYLLWKTSDTLQASLALAGLTLCLGGLRPRRSASEGQDLFDRPWTLWAGAILLGLLVTVRPPNVLIAAIVPFALILLGEWRRLGRITMTLALTMLVASGLSWAFLGTAMPYKAERATFNPETGYPAGDDTSEVVLQFERDRATSSLGVTPALKPRVTVFSGLSFLVGRHTGALVYFPAALFIALAALRKPDRMAAAVLAGVAATAFFFLLWLPFNYFGGASCVGNRYFLVSYAALPLALRRPLGHWSMAAVWTLAVVVGGSALASEWMMRGVDRTSQSHAYAGLFRRLPYETTASDLEGSRDHFFGKDFVRTVDPFVGSMHHVFKLDGSTRPAEFVLANLEREAPLRLLVHSPAERLELVYEDRGQTRIFPLSRPMGFRGLVEVQPTPPRRYHPLWFRNPWDHGKPYWVRLFRLAVRAADDTPVEAEVRFLGDEPFPPQIFERTVLSAELPGTALAGSLSAVEIRVRNDSARAWRSDRLFPVYLSYRVEPVGVGGKQVREGARTVLPTVVRPKQTLTGAVDLEWPQEPGRYRVRIDLVAEGIAWFERKTGAPLVDAVVEVVADTASAASAAKKGS